MRYPCVGQFIDGNAVWMRLVGLFVACFAKQLFQLPV